MSVPRVRPGFDPVLEVARALDRIRADIVRTPLEASGPLSRRAGARVFVKWECDQATGSFKLRGALNKVRALNAKERRAGLLSASTGNHGLGVVRAAALEGLEAVLYLPKTASPAKLARLREAGAVIAIRGASCERAEAAARRDARRMGKIYVSPYNDLDVIAGQGTIGLEILEDLPAAGDLAILIPVGGGGLAAGIASYVRSARPGTRIYGVEPAASAFMKASLAAGTLVAVREGATSADAVAGGIEPGSVTFPLCRDHLDGILTVGEERLRAAMAFLNRSHRRVVEGAGALAAAALLKNAPRFAGQTVVLVVSGGNIAPETFGRLVRGRR